MIENNESRVTAFQDRLAALTEVVENFEGIDETVLLGLQHCRAITMSHIYVGQIVVPPTIEELLSTGRLQLAIISFSQSIEGMRQLNFDIQSDRAVLSRRHPEMITLGLQGQDYVTCDFDAMRQSAAFRNELADNSYRHGAYVRRVVTGQQELRMELHDLLDRELGISHADSTNTGTGT